MNYTSLTLCNFIVTSMVLDCLKERSYTSMSSFYSVDVFCKSVLKILKKNTLRKKKALHTNA